MSDWKPVFTQSSTREDVERAIADHIVWAAETFETQLAEDTSLSAHDRSVLLARALVVIHKQTRATFEAAYAALRADAEATSTTVH